MNCQTCKRYQSWRSGYCYYKLPGLEWVHENGECQKYIPGYKETDIKIAEEVEQLTIFDLMEENE